MKISVSLIQQIHEHRNLGSLRFVKKFSFHKQITSRLGLALCLTIFPYFLTLYSCINIYVQLRSFYIFPQIIQLRLEAEGF